MKASYDFEVDALSIRWSEEPVEESDQVEPGVIVDYDVDGHIVAIEVLNATKRIKNFPQAVSEFLSVT
ncbi:MAG: DUF2283 domain-containing protein [Thermosynechococcaceae cyanobacterium MS004]|nr:DUF2283 domain-containing protein [Thermosynechococcaceae cyanobacterium MS004]